MIKIYVAVLFVIASVFASDSNEWKVKHGQEIIAIRDKCIKENPLPDAEFYEIQKNFTLVDTEEVRKYLFCTAKELGLFDEQDKLVQERIVEQYRMDLNLDAVKEIVKNCFEEHTEDQKNTDMRGFYDCLLHKENIIGSKIQATAKSQLNLPKPAA